MRAVGIKKTAAIGSEFLDDFLRCDGPLGDHLIGDRDGSRLSIRGGLLYGLRVEQDALVS